MAFRKLRVPASSANLGPAFDALGLALGVYLECRFRAADKLSIRVSGRDGALISSGEDNLIWQTAVRIASELDRAVQPHHLHRLAASLERGSEHPLAASIVRGAEERGAT